MMDKTIVEYIWHDDEYNFRSKTKIYDYEVNTLDDVEYWDFDGTSTGQIKISNGKKCSTEVSLFPVKLYNDPFRGEGHKMVLCDTYIDELPTKSNKRYEAMKILSKSTKKNEPWFGMEQEYFITEVDPSQMDDSYMNGYKEGKHYCGVGHERVYYRAVAEDHMHACIHAGVNICGINAEVVPGQWEFQIGPSSGIDIGDDVMMARFLLECVAEEYGVFIVYDPKPFPEFNGSGCHTNFSTKQMREGNEKKNKPGIQYIMEAINKLEPKHLKHMKKYGKGNKVRMTGKHETSDYKHFSYGVGRRDVSVRINNNVAEEGFGYFEDRRPGSNSNPYDVASALYKTCCVE